jgi:imidazolonepropionase-like amidohydrolase
MTGQWLVPGLMNTHVHLGLKLPGAAGDALATETDTEEVLRMAGNARLSLLSGVTTLRLVGEDHGTDFALRSAIDRGEVTGPRIKTAGEVIIPTGGHGSMEADGPYGFAHVVREQIKSGADWIKIAISGGISDPRGSISAAPMTDEEMSILIEVAHRNGIRVTAHNGSNEAARQALRFGIDGFEHGYHLDAGVLKEMKAKGVWLVPTIVVTQPGALEFYHKIGSPPWYLERVKITGADHWAMLQNAIRMGVKIALGTDQFPFEPNDGTTATVAEAELYVKAGMTPLQALQSATIQAAKMLEIDADAGSITAGKFADIVALSADPVKDIRALRTLDFVMKGGMVVRDDRREITAN